jgi:FMN phosphatase YigB (HAD superfamily)
VNELTVIIFDIDGTLVDESQSLMAQTDAVAHTFGSSLAERQAVVDAFFAANDRAVAEGGEHKNDIPQYLQWMGETLAVPITPELAVELATAWQAAFAKTFTAPEVFPDVQPCLAGLKERGYRLVAASGGTTEKKVGLLTTAKLIDFFTQVYGAADVGWQKQDVRFWQQLLAAEAVAPDRVVVVGNQINDDIRHPQALGMHTALIDRPGVLTKNCGSAEVEPSYRLQSLDELAERLK